MLIDVFVKGRPKSGLFFSNIFCGNLRFICEKPLFKCFFSPQSREDAKVRKEYTKS
jgi:hypothetical protein